MVGVEEEESGAMVLDDGICDDNCGRCGRDVGGAEGEMSVQFEP